MANEQQRLHHIHRTFDSRIMSELCRYGYTFYVTTINDATLIMDMVANFIT